MGGGCQPDGNFEFAETRCAPEQYALHNQVQTNEFCGQVVVTAMPNSSAPFTVSKALNI